MCTQSVLQGHKLIWSKQQNTRDENNKESLINLEIMSHVYKENHGLQRGTFQVLGFLFFFSELSLLVEVWV